MIFDWIIRAFFFSLIVCAAIFWGAVAAFLIPEMLKDIPGVLKTFGVVSGIVAGLVAITLLILNLKEKFPKLYELLELIVGLLLGALILYIVSVGILDSFKKPHRCSSGAARFGSCD